MNIFNLADDYIFASELMGIYAPDGFHRDKNVCQNIIVVHWKIFIWEINWKI